MPLLVASHCQVWLHAQIGNEGSANKSTFIMRRLASSLMCGGPRVGLGSLRLKRPLNILGPKRHPQNTKCLLHPLALALSQRLPAPCCIWSTDPGPTRAFDGPLASEGPHTHCKQQKRRIGSQIFGLDLVGPNLFRHICDKRRREFSWPRLQHNAACSTSLFKSCHSLLKSRIMSRYGTGG